MGQPAGFRVTVCLCASDESGRYGQLSYFSELA